MKSPNKHAFDLGLSMVNDLKLICSITHPLTYNTSNLSHRSNHTTQIQSMGILSLNGYMPASLH